MKKQHSSWRRFVQGGIIAAAGLLLVSASGFAQERTIRIGFMLPYTGTYARLGDAITNGFKLFVDQSGGTLGGLKVQYFAVDSEADPAQAPENTNRLIQRDDVHVLVGPVHSGVAIGMARIARDADVIMIDPNAGADQITGALCSPNIFRSSFSNWQPGYGTGVMMANDGHKTAVTLTWKYAAGDQQVGGFKDAFEKAGGKVIRDLTLPFPNVEFQAYLTEIASINPDALFVFFAGGGAVKFVKDYAAAGLKGKIPLYGTGFLTDGTLEAQGEAAEGIKTSLHYAESLDTPENKAFQQAYQKAYNEVADGYAVQGYDAAQLLRIGIEAVDGDLSDREGMIEAMEGAVINSPRGEWRMSDAHNPIQDFYARVVKNGDNVVTGVAVEDLEDPARGCRM